MASYFQAPSPQITAVTIVSISFSDLTTFPATFLLQLSVRGLSQATALWCPPLNVYRNVMTVGQTDPADPSTCGTQSCQHGLSLTLAFRARQEAAEQIPNSQKTDCISMTK